LADLAEVVPLALSLMVNRGDDDMVATVIGYTSASARAFIQEYFDAWQRGNEAERVRRRSLRRACRRLLAYYSPDVHVWLPVGEFHGREEVGNGFVRPFCSAFPGNVHEIQNLIYQDGVVAVEWRFKATHRGDFMQLPASGRSTDVPGCSVYFLGDRTITRGNIYVNFATLVEQIGAA
jgi:steroid delta-isomerase-like uncharacterized protein